MRAPRLGFLVFLSLLTLPFDAAAQPENRARVWIAAGLGAGRASDDEQVDFGRVLQAVYQKDAHHIAARIAYVSEFGDRESNYTEYGVQYGRTLYGSEGHLSLSSGVSVVRVCTARGVPRTTIVCDYSAGLPLVAEMGLRLIPVLGLGAQAFTNLNRSTPYYGLLFFFQAGWMP